jgi:hypothetical protein
VKNQSDIFVRISSSEKSFTASLLIIVLTAIIIQIILYTSGFYSISADESGRTLLAYQWMKGEIKETPTWLPFYTIAIDASLKIIPDLFWTPRIAGSLFGILAFISFIWLVHQLFRDRYITILSSVIGLFFPTRVILSAVPLSESMFFLFIFSGTASFIIWLRSGKDFNLVSASVCFAISSSIRYEGWFFSAALFVLIIIFTKMKREGSSVKHIIVVALIGFAFPVYWFIYQAGISGGNPVQFFIDQSRGYEKSQGITFLTILKNNHLTRFIHHNLIYICFPGLIVLVYLFFRDNLIRKLFFLLLLTFIPLVLISFTGRGTPTHNIWRISELWNILLIPFTAYFIKNIQSFDLRFLKQLQRMKVPLIVSVLIIYYLIHIYRLTGIDAFTAEDLRTGRFLEKEIIPLTDEKNKILIEVPDWSYINIIVASNNPDRFVVNSEGGPKRKENEIITYEKDIIPDELTAIKVKYLFIKSKELKNKIDAYPFFKKKVKLDKWTLYELQSSDNSILKISL